MSVNISQILLTTSKTHPIIPTLSGKCASCSKRVCNAAILLKLQKCRNNGKDSLQYALSNRSTFKLIHAKEIAVTPIKIVPGSGQIL